MKFLPRTLLWRSVLLIALLLVVAHLSWLEIFRISEREPRARQVADQIASVVNLTRSALITADRSEEHTSELQSRRDLVCRLLLEKKKNIQNKTNQLQAIILT